MACGLHQRLPLHPGHRKMYLPEHFEEIDPSQIRQLVDQFPLATLVANSKSGLTANHVPILFNGDRELFGHIALHNDMHEIIPDGTGVLAIFKGNDAYISPNWYPTKSQHHKHVPTWNYSVVHFHGAIAFHHDEKSKRAAVGRLTKSIEEKTNGSDAWKMADAPADYMEQMLAGIVAFTITIENILAKSKLSQNRDPVDFENVTKVLQDRGGTAMAERMKKIGNDRP